MKKTATAQPSKRIELERDVIADLEATDVQIDAIVGGKNYTRNSGIVSVNL